MKLYTITFTEEELEAVVIACTLRAFRLQSAAEPEKAVIDAVTLRLEHAWPDEAAPAK